MPVEIRELTIKTTVTSVAPNALPDGKAQNPEQLKQQLLDEFRRMWSRQVKRTAFNR
jgi:hypothetical protein